MDLHRSTVKLTTNDGTTGTGAANVSFVCNLDCANHEPRDTPAPIEMSVCRKCVGEPAEKTDDKSGTDCEAHANGSVGRRSPPPDYNQATRSSRVLVRRSLTTVSREMGPRGSREFRTFSLSLDTSGPPQARMLSRRMSFCPRGSLREVVDPVVLPPSLFEGIGGLKDLEEAIIEEEEEEKKETMLSIVTEVFIPFILAGLGMVAAGVLLSKVQYWDAFVDIPELIIMVPPLLGLKGNLEMTLASRISTQANLGRMETMGDRLTIARGNLALIQCQATVAGLVAALLAIAKSWAENGTANTSHVLLLATAAVLTATLASIVLASIMVLVVIVCRRFHLNPDNVATPVAASLGDITTLALLAGLSTLMHVKLGSYPWATPCLLGASFVALPLWVYISYRNPFTKEVLFHGWIPILLAIIISSGGGFILEYASARFEGLAAYQPVINGVAGNLVAVQASRISTYLHLNTDKGLLPSKEKTCVSPVGVFFGPCAHARTARILMLILIPGQVIFVFLVNRVEKPGGTLNGAFIGLYLTAAVLQVYILLHMARVLVYLLWTHKVDPDNATIPFLTAMGDLLGSGFLMAVYIILQVL
ncbi:solute carrier family 41 member 1-like [Ornithodoros turicata]